VDLVLRRLGGVIGLDAIGAESDGHGENSRVMR
jgi:hypothetical protein